MAGPDLKQTGCPHYEAPQVLRDHSRSCLAVNGDTGDWARKPMGKLLGV